MFTGIIRHMGEVTSKAAGKKVSLLAIASSLAQSVREGDSVAVNGVCLTVLEAGQKNIHFRLMNETLQRTNLGKLTRGSIVNLERPVAAGERFDGHFVMGHVDGVCMVTRMENVDADIIFTLQPPPSLLPYLVEKGSVTLDGVSLTVVNVSDKTFAVSVMLYTLKHTTLGKAREGNAINIEVDMIGKYVKRFMDYRNSNTE